VRTVGRLTTWAWAGLGLAGSTLVALTGSELLKHKPIPWWFYVHLPVSRGWVHHLFWLGVVALCAAWLGLGWELWRGRALSVPVLLGIGAAWTVPLFLGPAPFSHDMYSYLAQGSLLHHGINPYQHGPVELARFHEMRLYNTVSPFWRHTTAPYDPGFIGLASLIAGIVGSHLIAGVMLFRVVSLVGVALLAVFVPRLARTLGTDPSRAVWLAVISPMVLIELIAAGHNDALMTGLIVAGVYYAVRGRPLVGVVLCTLAVAVKLPAVAAVPMVVAAWLWATPPARRWRVVAQSAAVFVGILGAVSVITGVGAHWISESLISTPARVHLAITPATAAGYTIAKLLHSLGLASVGYRTLNSVFSTILFLLTAGLGAVLCWRVRYNRLAPYVGVLLLASVIGGPAAWPWYLSWGVALVAVDARAQRSRALPALLVTACFAIQPGGLVALSLPDAPWMFAAYLTLLVAAVLLMRPRIRPPRRSVPAVA
jgi:alpha-1,6-mannosyltransferase